MVAPVGHIVRTSDIKNHSSCPKEIRDDRCDFRDFFFKVIREEHEDDRIEIRKEEILRE